MKKLLSSTLWRVSVLFLIVFYLTGTMYTRVCAAGEDSDDGAGSLANAVPVGDWYVDGDIEDTQGAALTSADELIYVDGNVHGDDVGIKIEDKTEGSHLIVNGDVEGGVSGVLLNREGQVKDEAASGGTSIRDYVENIFNISL